jgi:hypothetical protein
MSHPWWEENKPSETPLQSEKLAKSSNNNKFPQRPPSGTFVALRQG